MFTPADYDAAIQLWDRMPGVILNESDGREEIAAFLRRNPDMSFLAFSNRQELLGTILCGHNGRAGQIYHLAVAEEHRNKGIATALLNASLEGLSCAGIPRCNIFVYNTNTDGHSFWLNAGWVDPTSWKVMQKILLG